MAFSTFVPTRRRFVQGLATLGGLSAFGLSAVRGQTLLGGLPLLEGNMIDLVIDERPVDITGRPRSATVVNGMMPGPFLRLR